MEADDPLGLSLGILLAIVSALRGATVPPGFAVAGVMSVQGAILPPDSIGEMVLLARESGAVMMALPTANRDDVQGLPSGLRDGLEFRYFDSPAGLAKEALEG
jgi:ATP-dependent Lon protease